MEYTFKKLLVDDVPLLKALLAVFADAFGDHDAYQSAVPDDAYLRSLLEKRHFIAVAALRDDQVVGGLAAYQLDKFEQARSEVYIYDLAVLEHHRRKGVATGLIRALGRIAKERGAYVMFVQADAGDEPAIRLYESLGTREDVHHFDIPTEESPPSVTSGQRDARNG